MNKYQLDSNNIIDVLGRYPRGLQIAEIAAKANLFDCETTYVLDCLIDDNLVIKELVGVYRTPVYKVVDNGG